MKLEEYSNLSQKEPFFETKNINTYKEFDNIYEELKENTLLYRGIHEAKYKIYTSAQREWITNEYSKNGMTYTQFIQSIISNIRKNTILSKYYKSLNINENDLLYISLLQHYGAPSPLLDFTYNINIALYFGQACFTNQVKSKKKPVRSGIFRSDGPNQEERSGKI